jgi:LysM repeat protein
MRRRSPGRWLAPLAIVVVAVAAYTVVHNGASNGGSGGGGTGTSTTSRPRPGTRTTTTVRRAKGPATYTVQSGDTFSQIAARTGVSLARLRALNPGVDEQALHIGERIRLRK